MIKLKNLQEVAKVKGFSLYKLSLKAGIPELLLRKAIKRQSCSIETLYRVAKALNVSMEDLIEEVPEKE